VEGQMIEDDREGVSDFGAVGVDVVEVF